MGDFIYNKRKGGKNERKSKSWHYTHINNKHDFIVNGKCECGYDNNTRKTRYY